MPKWQVTDELLDALAATSPEARRIVGKIRRKGAPPKGEFYYRLLEKRWVPFRELNKQLTDTQALGKFLRVMRPAIEKELGLKITTPGTLRKSLARGKKERERRLRWQWVPAPLARAIHGQRRMLVKDLNEAVIIRAAMAQALLSRDNPPISSSDIEP
jgi:hypothetical protein